MKNVCKKLQQARVKLHATALKKSGHNKFAGYSYFELADFLVPAQQIFAEIGLFGAVSFGEVATLTVTDLESGESIVFTSPMSTAELKGCHAVQNLGAVQTYLRRYLWVMALEIVEHDSIEATEPLQESPKSKKTEKPQEPVAADAVTTAVTALEEAAEKGSKAFKAAVAGLTDDVKAAMDPNIKKRLNARSIAVDSLAKVPA